MNFREIQVWKIKVVGGKQIEPVMGDRRGQLRELTPAVLMIYLSTILTRI